MLEYYFCEQCQKYHEPNRLINGQYLTACECEISTQNDTLDVNNRKSVQTINLSRRTNTDTNTVNYSYDSPFVSHQIQTPKNSIKQQQPIYNTRVVPSGTRYSNMPFRTIINEENKQQMKKIVITRQNDRYTSPTTIRKQIPIRSVSPIYRVQNVSSPPPTAKTYRSIPMQNIQSSIPMKLQHRTISPIETMQNIVYSQRTNTPIPSIKIIQNAPAILSQPQINVLPPLASTQPNQMLFRYSDAKIIKQDEVQRISLDRVSGQLQAQQPQESQREQYQQVEKNRFSLDRVSQNNNIIQEGEQDNECCGTLCYH